MNALFLRIDENLHKTLKEAAKKDNRSVNNYVTNLIKRFMMQQEKQNV